MKISIDEIARVTEAKIVGEGRDEVWRIIIDSRQMVPSEHTLFVAIKGERHDGHKFINELYHKKGIKLFLVEQPFTSILSDTNVCMLVVKDSLLAFQQIAAYYRQQFNIPVVGITGSNGKTIVKEWLFHILQAVFHVARSPKSYNSQTGVPLSVFQLESTSQIALFEAGISKKGEMERLQRIIQPTWGIFTNIGSAHQENFSTLKEKIDEKLKLFISSEVLIYCADHQPVDEAIKSSPISQTCHLLTWSFHHPATLQIVSVETMDKGAKITGLYQNKQYTIEIPFSDRASIENSIHCWLLALHVGVPTDIIAKQMRSISTVAMRLEQVPGLNGCTLINDSYNSDFTSLSVALDFLMQQQHPRKTLILSDLLQTGEDETELYQKIAKLIDEKKINRLIGIGQALYQHARLFSCEKEFYLSTDEFIEQFQSSRFHNEAILLKGARYFTFERISALLEQKVHRTVLEINLNALVHNLNFYRSKLNPGTKIIVMVKALSYGSGGYEIASLLEFQKVDYLAVAYVDEGIALRKANISLPIIVMSPEAKSIQLLIDYQLEPEIYSFEILQAFLDEMQKEQTAQLPIHIKIDTGMHRLGFLPKELDKLCNILKNNSLVYVRSVFSHLAASDEPIHDAYTFEQFDTFLLACEKIKTSLGYSFDRHILNSAGIERFPEYQMEMVRLGIGLYGVSNFNQDRLQTVSSLKTHISQIKNIRKGESIGYGRKTIVNRDTRLAILPIGYADGYTRRLSHKGRVWLNGQYAPLIGNICMDMCMIDVTDVPAQVNDEVELFGQHVTVQELAEITGTIPYEILTSISDRVKRIYINE
ncbi:MAG: bifunctional UDP-N-acetylmuramoyl-tripeptide:D-alanyl-D-alanine ligase/alanine racemase [Bacteroidales bacterium]|nr:bifunctional UDP-N-acetylmuramoyl-tripeptide:D-alanyl-D-alanine ligase/alanine racemase [Bacteroidales bacterium]